MTVFKDLSQLSKIQSFHFLLPPHSPPPSMALGLLQEQTSEFQTNRSFVTSSSSLSYFPRWYKQDRNQRPETPFQNPLLIVRITAAIFSSFIFLPLCKLPVRHPLSQDSFLSLSAFPLFCLQHQPY